MFINKNFSDLKKVAQEKSSEYLSAKPFPSIVFDNFFENEILNNILSDFPKNIKEIAEKIKDGKFSIDEVNEKITNKPRAYYVLKKLRDDGIIVEADKAGKSKTHYIFKK